MKKPVVKPFRKQQILDSSKLKEIADNNFKFNENGREFPKRIETLWEKQKLLVTSCYEQFLLFPQYFQ